MSHTDNQVLSAREIQVVALVAQGYRNREIAKLMFITEHTVSNHLHSIFHKLGVKCRLELALYAIYYGLYLTGQDEDLSRNGSNGHSVH